MNTPHQIKIVVFFKLLKIQKCPIYLGNRPVQFFGLLALTCLINNYAFAQKEWPAIEFPKDSSTYIVGEKVVVNGLPLKMTGFVSPTKLPQIAEWFRQKLGQPLVENTVANKLILGRAQGETYLTIQLETIGTGTRGLVAISNQKIAFNRHADSVAVRARWIGRLLPDSKLISQMNSDDNGQVATYTFFSNTYSEDVNAARITKIMLEDGLALEHEARVDRNSENKSVVKIIHGQTLFYKGGGKEAIAVISKAQDGKTLVVLNNITLLEKQK